MKKTLINEVTEEKIQASHKGRWRPVNEENPNTVICFMEGSHSTMVKTDSDANFLAIAIKDDVEAKKPARKRGRRPKLYPEDTKFVD